MERFRAEINAVGIICGFALPIIAHSPQEKPDISTCTLCRVLLLEEGGRWISSVCGDKTGET